MSSCALIITFGTSAYYRNTAAHIWQLESSIQKRCLHSAGLNDPRDRVQHRASSRYRVRFSFFRLIQLANSFISVSAAQYAETTAKQDAYLEILLASSNHFSVHM